MSVPTLVARYTYDALDRLPVVERASGRIRFRYAGTTTAVAQVVDDVSGSVILADDLDEMNEPISQTNTTLNRRMDLFSNHQGRAIGRSVPVIPRIPYLSGVEIWRQRALDVELDRVESGCMRALINLRLLYLHP